MSWFPGKTAALGKGEKGENGYRNADESSETYSAVALVFVERLFAVL